MVFIFLVDLFPAKYVLLSSSTESFLLREAKVKTFIWWTLTRWYWLVKMQLLGWEIVFNALIVLGVLALLLILVYIVTDTEE